jgi:hypothetical protein
VAAILTAEIIEPRDAIEQEIDDSDDNSDADGIAPDDDDSDDASVSIRGKVGRVAGIANLGWGRLVIDKTIRLRLINRYRWSIAVSSHLAGLSVHKRDATTSKTQLHIYTQRNP